MAASLAEGETTIYNAACEPYIQQLCSMINQMGGNVTGIGSNSLTIYGVKNLKGCTHKIDPDIIEIGSWIGLAALTKSDITIKGVNFKHLDQILNVFQDTNRDRELIVKKEIGSDVYTIRIETGDDNASFIEEIIQLIKDHPEMEVLISEYIEPTFSDELIKNSLYAMASSLLVIAFYIWIRFDW